MDWAGLKIHQPKYILEKYHNSNPTDPWLHEGCFDFCVELTVVQTRSFNLRKKKKKKNSFFLFLLTSLKKELSETVSLNTLPSQVNPILILFKIIRYLLFWFTFLILYFHFYRRLKNLDFVYKKKLIQGDPRYGNETFSSLFDWNQRWVLLGWFFFWYFN